MRHLSGGRYSAGDAEDGLGSLMLRLEDIRYRYPGATEDSLKGVSLEIDKGMFGLIGPNGAGKSTLMQIIALLLSPTSGVVRLNGRDAAANPDWLRMRLGYLPQEFGFYPTFSVHRMLTYLAQLHGQIASPRKRVDAVLRQVNLEREARVPVGSLSGGMKQRLGVAQALLSEPELLIVDEPTSGLDPEERGRLHAVLSGVSGGITVLLSTHILGDIATLCGRVGFLWRGELRIDTSPGTAVRSLMGHLFEIQIPIDALPALRSETEVLSYWVTQPGVVSVRFHADRSPDRWTQAVPVPPTLEDMYLIWTNRAHRCASAAT